MRRLVIAKAEAVETVQSINSALGSDRPLDVRPRSSVLSEHPSRAHADSERSDQAATRTKFKEAALGTKAKFIWHAGTVVQFPLRSPKSCRHPVGRSAREGWGRGGRGCGGGVGRPLLGGENEGEVRAVFAEDASRHFRRTWSHRAGRKAGAGRRARPTP